MVRDEESGYTEYASNVAYDFWGTLKKKTQMDGAHPQDFVRAKDDPQPVYPQSPPTRDFDTSAYNLGDFVGTTSVPSPIGPATHIYQPSRVGAGNPAIGEMIVGSTFTVR